MIPAPPPGAPAELPPRPDTHDGPPARPRVTWGWPEAIALYVVGYLLIANILVGAAIFAASGVEDPSATEGSLGLVVTVVVDAVFIAIMVLWLSRRHPGWLSAIGLPPRGERVRPFVWGAGMGVLLYPAIAIVVGLPLSLLLEALSGEPSTAPEQVPGGLSLGGKVIAVVLAVAVAPVMEELFYRGVLFRSIRDRHGFWAGALLSAVLFGLVHYLPSPWQDAVLLQSVMVFTGFAFAWIYERKGTILASIGAHVMFNVIGITLILSGAA